MKILISTFLFLASISITLAASDASKKPDEDSILREPFTLNLHIDKEHFYEEKFGKIPFVHDGNIYLFKVTNSDSTSTSVTTQFARLNTSRT